MATSKVLAPTNVTIQIPEFTDQPDQRVNSNCLDKEADAINALNTQITPQAITVTGGTGITITDNASYKCGRIVCLNFKASGSISSGSIIANISSGIARGQYLFAVDYNNDSFVPVYLYPEGNIKSFGSGSALKILSTYIV